MVCTTGHTLNRITLRQTCAPTRARAGIRGVDVVVELEEAMALKASPRLSMAAPRGPQGTEIRAALVLSVASKVTRGLGRIVALYHPPSTL